MDGVITANNHVHEDAWVIFNKRYDLPVFSHEDFQAKVVGKTNAEIAAVLFKREMRKEEAHLLSEEKEQIFRDIYKPMFKLTDGLLDFLAAVKDEFYPIAMATNAPETNMLFTLDNGLLHEYFNAVVHRDLVVNAKPHPDLYQLAAKKIGLDPKDCVVFEDSFTGIQAARAAGAKVVAVASTYPPEQLAPLADKVIMNFVGLSVADLQALFL